MSESNNTYKLDLHCQSILDEYRSALPQFEKMREVVLHALEGTVKENGLYVTAIETRIKAEDSLAGKLELKGGKYSCLSDITDILGARVITFYSDEVDKISALVDGMFEVDWANSVDKRKAHQLDSFGYSSLHYVCRIPREMYFDPAHPEINEFRFEVQMRTALQHVWATMNHDSGYKSGVEVPVEYLRSMNCLAGMLELADAQFSSIRTAINDYRRQVQSLVASGDFSEVPLNGDTYRSYLQIHPFDKLAKRIAAINQAEIHESSALPYFEVLKLLGFTTLGDVDRLVKEHSDEAYLLAVHQLGSTDLDIVSSTIAIQNLCVVYMLKNGGGVAGLKRIFDTLGVPSDANFYRAKRIMDIAQTLPFLN